MVSVTLTVNADALRQMALDLSTRRQEVLDLLDEINTNLDAVNRALRASTRQESLVYSESNPYFSYLVSKESGVYACTCPSFEYTHGLDVDGHCKHIRKVISQERFA